MILRIALVDDQEMYRLGFRMLLETQEEVEVVGEADDGRSALDLLARVKADVVLMDVRMPVLNGIDATARIAQLYPTIKTLVLTTYDQDDYAFGALSAGASGFLLKDTRTAQLHQALRAVDSGDAILTPRITRELLNRHMFRPIVTPQQRAAQQQLGMLSPREREVAELVAQGLTNAEIAQRLVVAESTVKTHVSHLMRKYGAASRLKLVVAVHREREAAL